MSSLPRPARLRALLAAAFAVAATFALCSAAQAAVTITIVPPGGGAGKTISTDEIENGDMDTTYSVRRADGGIDRVQVVDGISILQLLRETDTDHGYAAIEIPRPGGGTLRLAEHEVIDPFPPGFYTDAQGVTRFIGPTKDGAVAAEDHFEVSGTVVLTQKEPSRLRVRISPREKEVEVGDSVKFTAKAAGAGAGEKYVYTWRLRGESRVLGRGRSLTHDFEEQGTFRMLVAVEIEGSDPSVSDVATIQVGDPEESEQDRGGGGTDGSADSGAVDGSTGAGSTYDGSSAPPYTPPAPPTPPTPTPPPPTPRQPDQPGIVTDGTTVEGNLLADVSAAPSSALESAARAAREGQPREDEPDGAGVSEAALGVAGLFGLLCLGAGIELRQGRPRRTA